MRNFRCNLDFWLWHKTPPFFVGLVKADMILRLAIYIHSTLEGKDVPFNSTVVKIYNPR